MSANRDQYIYLDNAATTKVYIKAADEALKYYTGDFYNPSAMYACALDVKNDIEAASARLAKLTGALADEMVFTSGATEANNYALECGFKNKKGTLVISGGEHASVYEKAMQMKSSGIPVIIVPLDGDGAVDAAKLTDSVNENTALVSVIHASNETGALNDIKDLCAKVKAKNPNTIFHSDGVQAAFKSGFDFDSSDIDLYSISAHKVGGLKGVGALLIKRGFNMRPFITGGGQQNNRRSGTENVGGIISFAAAAEEFSTAAAKFSAHDVRQFLIDQITGQLDFVTVNGHKKNTGYILSLSFYGLKGEVLAHMLEKKGLLVGLGSACATHSKQPRVLMQMGLKPKQLQGSIRISFCPETKLEDIKYAAKEIIAAAKELKGIIDG